MAVEVKVPSVGESVAEGVLSRWTVPDGEFVEKGATLFELETDKATTDVPAPESGVVRHAVEEGTEVQIGSVVGTIDPDGEAASAPAKDAAPAQQEAGDDAAEPAGSGDARVAATSVARKIAQENRIDLSSVKGTGPGGRITREDVEAVAAALRDDAPTGNAGARFTSADTIQRLPAPSPASMPPGQHKLPESKAPIPSPPAEKPSTPKSAAPAGDGPESTREKMSLLRRRIAERLVEAQHTAAMLTTFNDVDMSAVLELRKQFKDGFKEKHGVGLGFMSFFVRACVEALEAYPRVNAMIDGAEIVQHHRQHIGVAVSTPKGLVVPVVRNAQAMTFARIEQTILDMALRARDGKIEVDEMQGGTFTITNGGVFGSMLSTPILNPPQSAILGMHRIEERPVARDGQVVIRPMMYLALSYDHRIVDGREAVGFLVRVKECIENPARMLLGV